MIHITGIGTRDVPANYLSTILEIVNGIGELAGHHGWTLRSGGADGMDSIFEKAWRGPKEIFIPWNGFSDRRHEEDGAIFIQDRAMLTAAEGIVSKVHPAWGRLKRGARALHTRNVFQALGPDLDKPSDLCLYYAEEGANREVKGGTRTAVEICKAHGVPTLNLMNSADMKRLERWLDAFAPILQSCVKPLGDSHLLYCATLPR